MKVSEQNILKGVVVRPILREERNLWQELMRAHHYLGFQKLVGERIEYVATVDGEWVALLAWAAAALKLSARDHFIGWNWELQMQRLKYVVNNVRYLILPEKSVPNLASRVLALNLKRLSQDYSEFYGHPVFLAETFVDLSRNRGTCYLAQGWEFLGETKGFGRKRTGYITHGSKKGILVKPLCLDALHRLSDPLRDPIRREERVFVIAQKEVGEKTNEIPELRNLLAPLPIKGAHVTTDAMHTQVDTAVFLVRETGAHQRNYIKRDGRSQFQQLLVLPDSSQSCRCLAAPQGALFKFVKDRLRRTFTFPDMN